MGALWLSSDVAISVSQTSLTREFRRRIGDRGSGRISGTKTMKWNAKEERPSRGQDVLIHTPLAITGYTRKESVNLFAGQPQRWHSDASEKIPRID